MNICIDVGNSTISLGIFKENKLYKKLTFTTDTLKTDDEYSSLLVHALKQIEIDYKDVDGVIYSSVVPPINQPLKSALKRIFKKEIVTIEPGTKTGLIIRVDNPNEIGNDLIADLVGAKEKYGYPLLIADLGTASKILLIDKNGVFNSCVIMPGLSISAQTLSSKAALLPEVSLDAPKTILAKNTVEAMNAGIVFGHAEMILGLARRYEKELGYSCKKILTGGGAIFLKDILKEDFYYDRDVCLEGLNVILRKNGGAYYEK